MPQPPTLFSTIMTWFWYF